MRFDKNWLLSLLLLCVPTFAHAQCGTARTQVFPAFSYATPVVHQAVVHQAVVHETVIPVAVAQPFVVAVPGVSYLYGGATVGLQQAQPQQPSVQPNATQVPRARASDSSELSDAALDKLIERLEKRLQQRQNDVQPRDSGPPPVKTTSTTGSALSILTTHCAACHTGNSAKGGVAIFSSPGVLNVRVDRNKVWEAADQGRMPPAAQKDVNAALLDAEVDVLDRWRRGV